MNINAGKPPRTVTWLGCQYTIVVDRQDSGGIVGIFESTVPSGEGPPIHIHYHEDEVIHILEGEYQFWLDGAVSRAGSGASIFLPRGVPHTFRVVSKTPGRNLAVLTPGGFETFFADAVRHDLRLPPDPATIAALSELYGIEFFGPPRWSLAASEDRFGSEAHVKL
jgi:quercetin dioxygenase-like cupin family protein